MKGIEIQINNQETVGVELDGVISVILLYHEGKTTLTVSGLQNDNTSKSNVTWLDQNINEEDSIYLKLSQNISSKSVPTSIRLLNTEDENKQKLKTYYTLRKELEDGGLL